MIFTLFLGVDTETKTASKECHNVHNIKSLKNESLNWTDTYESVSNDYNDVNECKFEYIPEIDEAGVDNEQNTGYDLYKNLAKKCIVCKVEFTSFKDYDNHNWEIHQKTPFCDLCGKSFKYRRGVIEHQRLKGHKEVPNGWKPFKCKRCDESSLKNVTFNSYIEFCFHNLEAHKNDDNPDIHEDCVTNEQNAESEYRNLAKKCIICKKKFRSFKEYDQHNWVNHQRRPFCDLCGKSFKFRNHVYNHQDLEGHKKIPDGWNPFICGICDEDSLENVTFNSYIEFCSHNWNVHKNDCITSKSDENESLNITDDFDYKPINSNQVFEKDTNESESNDYEGKFNDTNAKHNINIDEDYVKNEQAIECGDFEILAKKCFICNIKFDWYKDYDHHNREVHQKRPFCGVCGKSFNTRKVVSVHQRSKGHKEIPIGWKPFKCEKCDESSLEKVSYNSFIEFCFHNWKVHRNDCRLTTKLNCNICNEEFSSSKKLDMHNWEAHQIRPCCDICGKKFNSGKQMKKHKLLHNPEPDPIQCHDCGEFLNSKRALVYHRRKKHEKQKIENKYSCETCGRKCVTKASLEKHKLTHMNREKTFLCNICGKGFFSQATLKKHSMYHTDERPFSCANCGISFKVKKDLKRHMTIHTGERPHSCDVCSKTFRFAGDLTVHKRKHTGEKPFSCELCQKAFYSSNDLNKHKKTPEHLNMISKIDIKSLDEL